MICIPSYRNSHLNFLQSELICFYEEDTTSILAIRAAISTSFIVFYNFNRESIPNPPIKFHSIDVLMAYLALHDIDISDAAYMVYRPEVFEVQPE